MQVRLRPDSERWSTKFVCDVYFCEPVRIKQNMGVIRDYKSHLIIILYGLPW